MSAISRVEHLRHFYESLSLLAGEDHVIATLAASASNRELPRRGVYFFFEDDEVRSDTGRSGRVVRVGTHGLGSGSRSTLKQRLKQHLGGTRQPGGNHRGSIFRLLVGEAQQRSNPELAVVSWGKGSNASIETKRTEVLAETAVSNFMRRSKVLVISIDDEPGPQSLRGYVERNAIALLSNFRKPALDLPSTAWLGSQCSRERVRLSGLWNNNHVDEQYDTEFPKAFRAMVLRQTQKVG